MRIGVKKIIAVVLLASTATATGALIRFGNEQETRSAALLEQAGLAQYGTASPRYEQPSSAGRADRQQPVKNQTELLARSLAEEIVKHNKNGPEVINDATFITVPTEEALNRIIDERVAQFDPASLVAAVPDKDLKTVAGRNTAALQRYLDASLTSVRDTLQKITLPQNGFSEEDVKKLAEAYGEIVARLAALPVPEDLAQFHKQELELFLTQKNFLDAIVGYQEDPLGTIVVAKYGDFYIQQVERDLSKIQNELTEFSNKKLSLYHPADAQSIAEKILLIRRAYAVVPTIDNKAILTAVANTIKEIVSQVAEWAKDAARWAADKAWIMAVEVLKKRLLDMLVDQIVQWVQGGGSPKFITDWKAFLSDAFNAGVGDIVKQLGLGFLCSPFNLQVNLAFSPIPKFSQRVTCTLDKIVGNINNFYGDFRNGGWIAYQTQWQPAGNYYGSVLTAYDEALKEGTRQKEAAKNEGIANQGFLSTKRCVDPERDLGTGELTGGCSRYEVTTPGKTIGDTLSKAVGSDIDYIVNSRDLSAYVAAISNAVYNRLVRGAVGGITALTTPSAPSGGYIPGGVGGPCAGLAGSALQGCLDYQRTVQNLGTQALSLFDALKITLATDQDTKTFKEETLLTTQLTVSRLQQLKTCDSSLQGLDQQITAYQNKATVVANEIADLDQKISDMEQFILRVESIPKNRLDLLSEAGVEAQAFGDPVIAITNKDDAEAEKNAAEATLASITSQLQACLANQALLQQQQQQQQQQQPEQQGGF